MKALGTHSYLFSLFTLLALAAVEGSAQCDNAEHSTNWEDAWQSCETSANPNPDRGEGHWIMYDLGDVYSLLDSKIWNFNVNGSTGYGVRNCFFDYSLNGSNWETWGSQEIPQAPGSDDYVGVPGPDFGGIAARYLLISVQSNWDGGICSGFAEIRVNREYLGVSINEINPEIQVSIYPNPANEQLVLKHFHNEVLNLQIINASGQQLLQEQVSARIKTLDVSDWSSGLYVLILSDQRGNKATKRFVVFH